MYGRLCAAVSPIALLLLLRGPPARLSARCPGANSQMRHWRLCGESGRPLQEVVDVLPLVQN